MPSKSDKQRRFFGVALAYKRGELATASQKIKDAANSMTEKQITDFAKKVEK